MLIKAKRKLRNSKRSTRIMMIRTYAKFKSPSSPTPFSQNGRRGEEDFSVPLSLFGRGARGEGLSNF
jgi:hypothetical protein